MDGHIYCKMGSPLPRRRLLGLLFFRKRFSYSLWWIYQSYRWSRLEERSTTSHRIIGTVIWVRHVNVSLEHMHLFKLAKHIRLLLAKTTDFGGTGWPANVYGSLPNLFQQQTSGKRRVKQLDFRVRDPFVLKGDKPLPKEYGRGLTPLPIQNTWTLIWAECACTWGRGEVGRDSCWSNECLAHSCLMCMVSLTLCPIDIYHMEIL